MNGWFGLIELLLVFGAVLGWGLWELRSTRKYKKDQATHAAKDDASRR